MERIPNLISGLLKRDNKKTILRELNISLKTQKRKKAILDVFIMNKKVVFYILMSEDNNELHNIMCRFTDKAIIHPFLKQIQSYMEAEYVDTELIDHSDPEFKETLHDIAVEIAILDYLKKKNMEISIENLKEDKSLLEDLKDKIRKIEKILLHYIHEVDKDLDEQYRFQIFYSITSAPFVIQIRKLTFNLKKLEIKSKVDIHDFGLIKIINMTLSLIKNILPINLWKITNKGNMVHMNILPDKETVQHYKEYDELIPITELVIKDKKVILDIQKRVLSIAMNRQMIMKIAKNLTNLFYKIQKTVYENKKYKTVIYFSFNI